MKWKRFCKRGHDKTLHGVTRKDGYVACLVCLALNVQNFRVKHPGYYKGVSNNATQKEG